MAASTCVEDYLAALPEAPRAALEKLRKTIKATALEATETISYQMPAYKLHGRFLVSYAAFKDHWQPLPREHEGPRGIRGRAGALLSRGKERSASTADEPLPSALVKKILKTRIEEKAALTRR